MATVLTSSIVMLDRIYEVKLTIISFIRGNTKTILPYNLSLTITRGFWKTERFYEYPEITDHISEKELKRHLEITDKLWDTCHYIAYRGTVCETAGVACTILGVLFLYFHCTTFIIFRVTAVVYISLAAFIVMIGYFLICVSIHEYFYCLWVLNTAKYGRTGYFSGRKFNYTLYLMFSFKLMIVTEICFLLPVVIIGAYLVIFKRYDL